jgi:hypothetical protein
LELTQRLFNVLKALCLILFLSLSVFRQHQTTEKDRELQNLIEKILMHDISECFVNDTIRYDTIRYDTIRYDTTRHMTHAAGRTDMTNPVVAFRNLAKGPKNTTDEISNRS